MKVRIAFVLVLLFSVAFASDIAVVTVAVGDEYRKIVSPGIENKKKYCELHGYDFIISEESLDPSRPPSWSKVLLFEKLMETSSYKWLFWTDADSLIMNHAIRLEELIDEKYNMVITVDFASICAGEFFMKNCNWSKEFLKIIYNHTECIENRWWEQCAMIEELKINPSHYAYIKLLPQRIMNSFATEVFPQIGLKEIYQPGDFIFHFAGSSLELMNNLMQKYSKETMNSLSLFTLDYYLGIYGLQPSFNVLQTPQFVTCLEIHPPIHAILEMGLNTGHNTEMFFTSCKQLKKIVVIDSNKNPYVKPATEYFSRKYKDRFSFLEGDLQTEMFKHEALDAKFDLVYIDKADENILTDILNAQNFTHAKTLLWVNNIHSSEIRDAVYECEKRGIIKIIDTHKFENFSWVEARYTQTNF